MDITTWFAVGLGLTALIAFWAYFAEKRSGKQEPLADDLVVSGTDKLKVVRDRSGAVVGIWTHAKLECTNLEIEMLITECAYQKLIGREEAVPLCVAVEYKKWTAATKGGGSLIKFDNAFLHRVKTA